METTTSLNIIETQNAPAPLGHYSQAVVHNGIAYVSGQLPIDPKNTEHFIEGIEAQTLQTLKNLEAVLIAAGSNKDHVLKCTIFISDIGLWAAANKVYGEFFGKHLPARSAVPTKDLPKGFFIEIEAIAAVIDS